MRRLALVLVIACSSKQPASTPTNHVGATNGSPPGDPCFAAAEHAAYLSNRDDHMQRVVPLDRVAIHACHDDHWPAAATDCMIAAADHAAFEKCLTPEIEASYNAHYQAESGDAAMPGR